MIINSIKVLGAYLKGQMPRFYIIPGEPVVVVSADVFFLIIAKVTHTVK